MEELKLKDWQEDVMMFFQERGRAMAAAEQVGREQRQQAVDWLKSVVRPAFDAVRPTMTYGARVAQPRLDLDPHGASSATFPVSWRNKPEFTYKVETVIDPEGLKVKVTSPSGTSRYTEPTFVTDISVEDIRDDLIAAYKASFPPVPAVV